MSKRSNESYVWNYFKRTADNKKVKCNKCGDTLSFMGGSTSSMRSHISKRHNIHENDEDADDPKPKQQSLFDTGFTSGRTCNKERQKKITDLIANMIAQHNLPLSMVEWDAFRALLKFTEPNYVPICHETIKKMINEKAEKVKIEIKKATDKASHISLTTDAWTANNNAGYLAITSSFLTSDFVLQSPVLDTILLEDRHTAAFLEQTVVNAINDWGLHGKVSAIVHDNASNIAQVASHIREGGDVPCSAHTLQLCIQESMGTNKTASNHPIANAVNAASHLVAHFNHSALATSELLRRQVAMSSDDDEVNSKKPLKLIQSCKTRWNSIYFMFQRLTDLRWPVVAVLSDIKFTKHTLAKTLDLKDSQWTLIKDLLPVLKQLTAANTILCGEKYCSLAMLYPVLQNLMQHYLIAGEEDSPTLKTFIQSLRKEITRRFYEKMNCLAVIATAVDPRYKSLDVFPEEERQEIKEEILRLMNEVAVEVAPATPLEDDEVDSFFKSSTLSSVTTVVTVETEYARFEAEDSLKLKECPLKWWQANKLRFPRLSSIALQYLGIPATSVASERHFSKAGLIITKHRSSLASVSARSLLMVNHNLKYLSQPNI